MVNNKYHFVFKGGRKKNIPFRRQRMEMDCTVPQAESSSYVFKTQVDDPYVADLLKVADSRIAQLEKEAQMAKEDKATFENKLKVFRQQVGQVLKGFYHRIVFAVCLQSDPESYEWDLSAKLVDLK